MATDSDTQLSISYIIRCKIAWHKSSALKDTLYWMLTYIRFFGVLNVRDTKRYRRGGTEEKAVHRTPEQKSSITEAMSLLWSEESVASRRSKSLHQALSRGGVAVLMAPLWELPLGQGCFYRMMRSTLSCWGNLQFSVGFSYVSGFQNVACDSLGSPRSCLGASNREEGDIKGQDSPSLQHQP